MSKFRLICAAVLALIALIIVLQNTEPVETRLLFVTLTMPRAVLLMGTTIIGFILGVLWSIRFARKSDAS